MKREELIGKSEKDLLKLLEKKREELKKVSLSILQKKEKNVKKSGAVRKDVARIKTALMLAAVIEGNDNEKNN